MANPKKKSGPLSKPQTLKLSLATHIRRCHKCDAITECDEHDVKACASCGKRVAPFYFFSDAEVVPHGDNALRPSRLDGKVRPVLGLTAYW